MLVQAILSLVAEGLLPAVLQIIVEYLAHAISGQVKAGNTLWASLGYASLGATAGGLSVIVLPTPVFIGPLVQLAVLIGATCAAGLAASAIGVWRRRRGEVILRIDQFAFGALLGFSFGVVRLLAT